MDVKEAGRVVIAKPVASRPSCSTYRSFSELLAGAINSSPSKVSSETAVSAIRPKSVRFKTTENRAHAVSMHSSQTEILEGAADDSSSDKELRKSDSKPVLVYKPLAKSVSKSTVSLLANMGKNFNTLYQHQNQYQNSLVSKSNIPSSAETNLLTETSKISSHHMEEDVKAPLPMSNCDRPSYDGYNWRKYGQKQVKGSEYPRSYYKCTHPNCPVKKKVERSLDGQIAEIVYKGEHSHSKPQPPKRNSSATQGTGFLSEDRLWSDRVYERIECCEGRLENQNEVGISTHSSYQSKAAQIYEPISVGAVNPDNLCGLSGEREEESRGDEPKSKRRKGESQSSEAGISCEALQEQPIIVQSSNDSEVIGDGFRWRKYGQKVVKGNPYPRSYYRCTSIKCNVRKHVERSSDDPRAFIMTYEGKHNHEMPIRNKNPVSSETDAKTNRSKDKA